MTSTRTSAAPDQETPMRSFHAMILFLSLCGCSCNKAPPIEPGDAGFDAGTSTDAGPVLSSVQNADGTWGIQVEQAGKASASSRRPIRIDSYFFGARSISTSGYTSVVEIGGGFRGTGTIAPWSGVSFDVTDTWTLTATRVTAQRSLSVSGSRPFDRFMDALVMDSAITAPRSSVDYFVPGLIYGGSSHLKPDCIGGSDTYGPGFSGVVRVREDRLPAPVFGLHFDDGTSVTLLNLSPRGGTIKADAEDTSGGEVWDERLDFGALGAEQTAAPTSPLSLGYWFPGSEGEVTYNPITLQDWLTRREDTGAHQWRLRLHPVKNGLRHDYTLTWRFGSGEDFTAYQKNVWREVWSGLDVNAQVRRHDIEAVRRALTDFTASRAVTEAGNSGLLSAIDARTGDPLLFGIDQRAYLGFIGKNLENAEHLLREAQRRPGADAVRLRGVAGSIIDTFLVLDQSPPSAEGLRINGGTRVFYPHDGVCFLRPFTDDFNALLRAYQFERAHGREHPTWLGHVKDFSDWLLTQQAPDGSFPRAWNASTGTVFDASKNMSGLAVPLLLRMAQVTGEPGYQAAALRAGQASWQNYLDNDKHFVGATPDRPNVLVHESTALAITTYGDLYQATQDLTWLERARTAADINETWYILWNVPPPLDVADADLSVKATVTTVGMDVCTSSNSGVDYYNANDVDAYARLYKWTGDAHYLDVARLLMHNTKSMTALPGRPFDLSGPGMQQEFWFLGPPRRQSWIREYTPWITANQLHGIFLTEEFDP